MKKNYKVGVYGLGNFGYAILKHLDENRVTSMNISLCAYDRKAIVRESLREKRRHPFFHQSTRLSGRPIKYADTPAELLENCDILILAVSSEATRDVAKIINRYSRRPIVILNTAKALDNSTGQRLSKVISKELTAVNYTYAAIAGGTIARDLFKHEPLGVDIACEQSDVADLLKSIIESDNLSVDTTRDLLGVEYAGSCKNLIAILAGTVKGLGFSYGAETKIISQTAQAFADVCVDRLGAQASTFGMGSQCWGNDLWMSCTGDTRNREFGVMLGRGVNPSEALAQMTSDRKTIEGYNTLRTIYKVPGFESIKSIGILHDIVITGSSDVYRLREYFLSNR